MIETLPCWDGAGLCGPLVLPPWRWRRAPGHLCLIAKLAILDGGCSYQPIVCLTHRPQAMGTSGAVGALCSVVCSV